MEMWGEEEGYGESYDPMNPQNIAPGDEGYDELELESLWPRTQFAEHYYDSFG